MTPQNNDIIMIPGATSEREPRLCIFGQSQRMLRADAVLTSESVGEEVVSELDCRDVTLTLWTPLNNEPLEKLATFVPG